MLGGGAPFIKNVHPADIKVIEFPTEKSSFLSSPPLMSSLRLTNTNHTHADAHV